MRSLRVRLQTTRLLMVLAGSALATPVALARPPSVEKAFERRAEVKAQVEGILSGTVLPGVSRIHYLGEEAYAASLLIKALDTPELDVRRNIAQALAQLTVRQAEGVLVQLTRDPDAPVRMSAVAGLGRLHSRALRGMSSLLKDKTLGVRREAAHALGDLHDPRLGRALMSAAQRESEPDARAQMLIAVGDSRDRKEIHALERFLHASSESTRLAAAQALCHLGAPSGLAVARAQLASKEPLDRRHGIELFEGAPAKISGPLLHPLLADPDPHVAALAARTLHDGGEARMIDWLVLASARAKGEGRFPFEDQLEQLQVTPAQREAILRKAGMR